jgi:hypothetical protein
MLMGLSFIGAPGLFAEDTEGESRRAPEYRDIPEQIIHIREEDHLDGVRVSLGMSSGRYRQGNSPQAKLERYRFSIAYEYSDILKFAPRHPNYYIGIGLEAERSQFSPWDRSAEEAAAFFETSLLLSAVGSSAASLM